MPLLYPGTKAFAAIQVNAASVSETTDHFLHQVNMSFCLSNAYFKSLISSRANLLIWDPVALVVRPSWIVLNLVANELFVLYSTN